MLSQYGCKGSIVLVFLMGLFFVSASVAWAQEEVHADMVLLNAKVITMDEAQPQAEAVAILDRLILDVGSDDEMNAYVGPKTRVIDLAGKLVIPGFIEGHAHFLSLGYSRMKLELSSARSWDDVIVQVGGAAAKASPGEWLTGRG
jgi:predicted amidohydrolase YtcJ